jgi:hypothetical protein
MDFPICPLCGQAVNTNTDAHITDADGSVKHHECPINPVEPVALPADTAVKGD